MGMTDDEYLYCCVGLLIVGALVIGSLLIGAFQVADAIHHPIHSNTKITVLYTDFNQKQILTTDGVVYNYYEGDSVPYIIQNYNFKNMRDNTTYNCQLETIPHVWISDILGINSNSYINNCIEVKS